MTEPTLPKQIWFHLAEQGGWWRPGEVRDDFSEYGINRISMALRDMNDRGELERKEGEHPRYGVTVGCIPPKGVRLEAIMRALSMEVRR